MSASAEPARRIALEVGERRFTTLVSTLSEESTFFAALLSDRWTDSQSDDGSYFIDADGDLFVHILRYLRRGLLPVAYDNARGFDYGFYQALAAEAEYFGIDRLHRWIKEKKYLQTVRISYSGVKVHKPADTLETTYGDVERLYIDITDWSELPRYIIKTTVREDGKLSLCVLFEFKSSLVFSKPRNRLSHRLGQAGVLQTGSKKSAISILHTRECVTMRISKQRLLFLERGMTGPKRGRQLILLLLIHTPE
jgi:hypothetical protein